MGKAKDDLTYEYVDSRLRYEPETGLLFWKEKLPAHGETKRQVSYRGRWNKRFSGQETGYEYRDGRTSYKQVNINNKNYLAHRLAWLIYYKEWPKKNIDHINGNGIDNRIKNLRDASQQENLRNARMQSNNSSGVRGVSFDRRRQVWLARIKISGKSKHLGYFTNFDEAVETRKHAERKHNFHKNHGRAA